MLSLPLFGLPSKKKKLLKIFEVTEKFPQAKLSTESFEVLIAFKRNRKKNSRIVRGKI